MTITSATDVDVTSITSAPARSRIQTRQRLLAAATRLFADRGLAPVQREQRLARLLDDFSEAERRRVQTLADEGLLPR